MIRFKVYIWKETFAFTEAWVSLIQGNHTVIKICASHCTHIFVRIIDTKMSTLLHDNFTLFSLQMQVTECKSKVNGLRRYTFQAETNFRILNLILLSVVISVTALILQFWLRIMNRLFFV